MQDRFTPESVIRHREARTGKPFRHTKRQERFLERFDEDAAQAEQDVETFIAKMDDRTLLDQRFRANTSSLKWTRPWLQVIAPRTKRWRSA